MTTKLSDKQIADNKAAAKASKQLEASASEAALAVAEFRTQQNQWAIADAILTTVPANSKHQGNAFWKIQQACRKANVKPLSVSAMRQYRDTASRWDPATRINGVNYTAHRKALGVKNPTSLLAGVIKAAGSPSAVTVAAVTAAVNASNGVQTLAEKKAATKVVNHIAEVDWNSAAAIKHAVNVVSNLTDAQVTKAAGTLRATIGSEFHELGDRFDKANGVGRKAATKVGKKPTTKKPAVKKASATQVTPKGGARKGRVKGA